ncbi:hypothetical protein CGCA056_v003489 [Colletotrichum aenigma]|uniref:uncharacterized protein n=1 Tax=Colletotrichum aenigma TaxID=1215731 RepID=UPI0018728228|nr:uncharacterized protein CGCA056_v003489 [Colletotrichum aenigma]KAF5525646.1 hypothetical protein CGCA056_v003489 [Colletotrichum aenigma]
MQGFDGIRDKNGNYHNEIDLHLLKSQHNFQSFLPLHFRTLLFLCKILARLVIEWQWAKFSSTRSASPSRS